MKRAMTGFWVAAALSWANLSFGAVTLVEWSSAEGIKRLERSQQKADFYKLANFFQPQPDSISCGPVSATILLNALRIGTDKAPWTAFDEKKDGKFLPIDSKTKQKYDPRFREYTVTNVFTPATEKAKSRATIYGKPVPATQAAGASPAKPASDFGLQLHQLEAFLKAHGLDATKRVVDGSMSEELIRTELKENMGTPTDFVLVNFARKVFDQKGGGHISPLAAYDEKSDSFLVLDVNPHTAGWFWVGTKDLISAMNTKDTVENRGYVVVREGK